MNLSYARDAEDGRRDTRRHEGRFITWQAGERSDVRGHEQLGSRRRARSEWQIGATGTRREWQDGGRRKSHRGEDVAGHTNRLMRQRRICSSLDSVLAASHGRQGKEQAQQMRGDRPHKGQEQAQEMRSYRQHKVQTSCRLYNGQEQAQEMKSYRPHKGQEKPQEMRSYQPYRGQEQVQEIRSYRQHRVQEQAHGAESRRSPMDHEQQIPSKASAKLPSWRAIGLPGDPELRGIGHPDHDVWRFAITLRCLRKLQSIEDANDPDTRDESLRETCFHGWCQSLLRLLGAPPQRLPRWVQNEIGEIEMVFSSCNSGEVTNKRGEDGDDVAMGEANRKTTVTGLADVVERTARELWQTVSRKGTNNFITIAQTFYSAESVRTVVELLSEQWDTGIRPGFLDVLAKDLHQQFLSRLSNASPTVLDPLSYTRDTAFSLLHCQFEPSFVPRRLEIMNTAGAPHLGQFLVRINGFVAAENEAGLTQLLQIVPPFDDDYSILILELRNNFPAGETVEGSSAESALMRKCEKVLQSARDGINGSPSWTNFVRFVAAYLAYLRDVDQSEDKYLETYQMLHDLQLKANSALSHASLGNLMLPTVTSCAQTLCRLAIGLDKRPDLVARLQHQSQSSQLLGEHGERRRQTLPEQAVDLLRTAFTTCLNDRSSGLSSDGKPEGKKRGIYTIANICLKALFQSQKTRNAYQIFDSIGKLSPPLSAYPKSQRITYFYYLGRFQFQNSHFWRAAQVLQEAYDECPADDSCMRQRRLILIYLLSSNIVMGRFPTHEIFKRGEAEGLYDRFFPVMRAIRDGDLVAFHQYLGVDGPYARWFLRFRILLQLRSRCEVLVWRSLVRKTWILCGTRPPRPPQLKAPPPLIDIQDLDVAFDYCRQQTQEDYLDDDFDGADADSYPGYAGARAVVSKLGSLLSQGLINGYIAPVGNKFAILGAKDATSDEQILEAAFPRPYAALEKVHVRRAENTELPGWNQDGGSSGTMAGVVFNLSGARPAGSV